MTAMCSFPDCPNHASPKASKGLCNSHYWQMHKGRPLTPLSYRRNVTEPWILSHVDHTGDECLVWPFGKTPDGRAQTKWHGKQVMTSRVMCELAYGKPPTDEHEAAHSCGNGNGGCVHPKHLRWATPKENAADKIVHGTVLRGEDLPWAKLTEGKVRAIREFAHTVGNNRVLGDLFGVNAEVVRRLLAGHTWRHVE